MKTPMLTTADYLALAPVPADERIPYGHQPDQFGDLYIPVGEGPHPVVVLIHGGCWQAKYDLAPLGQLAAALRATGIAVWSIEYRRLGGGGGWPATFRDVAAGADALGELADRYPLDLNRVVAMGHSAGGHLALWLAGRHKLPPTSDCYAPEPLSLRGVISLAGIGDLADGIARELCGGACGEIAAGTSHLNEASPVELLPFGIPHIHLVGEQDGIVPPAHVRGFVERATTDSSQLILLPDAGHFEPVTATSTAWRQVRDALHQLI
jgi:acetyl esterase/lipase